MIVELDLVSQDSIAAAFARIRAEAGDPNVLVQRGISEGRDLLPEKRADTAMHMRRAAGRFSSPRKFCRPAQEGRRVVFPFL